MGRPNRPNASIVIARERQAWKLRCRGLTLESIAEAMQISTSGVHKILRRVEDRESRRLSEHVHRVKARQTGQLDHVIEEALSAWHKSKTPRKRATSRTSPAAFVPPKGEGGTPEIVPGDEVKTHEVIEREGDTGYLYLAMQAQAHQRSIWGLDVQAQAQEPMTTVSAMVQDIMDRGKKYEGRKQAEAGRAGEPGGPDPVGAGEVRGGPEPVQ